uniref:Uncharacterized protein n=1 Tax=Anguilla anguilla TaxID=7936 RepID=A0A0E9UWY1_ANGAN
MNYVVRVVPRVNGLIARVSAFGCVSNIGTALS